MIKRRTHRFGPALTGSPGRQNLDGVHQRQRCDQEQEKDRVGNRDRAKLGNTHAREEDRINQVVERLGGLHKNDRKRYPPDDP